MRTYCKLYTISNTECSVIHRRTVRYCHQALAKHWFRNFDEITSMHRLPPIGWRIINLPHV